MVSARPTQNCVVRSVILALPTPSYHMCGAHRQGPASHTHSCVRMAVQLGRCTAGRLVSARTCPCLAMVSVCTRQLQETKDRGSTVQTQIPAWQVTRLVTTLVLIPGDTLTCVVEQVSATLRTLLTQASSPVIITKHHVVMMSGCVMVCVSQYPNLAATTNHQQVVMAV